MKLYVYISILCIKLGLCSDEALASDHVQASDQDRPTQISVVLLRG